MGILAQASTVAGWTDNVFLFILALCVAFLVFITFLMVFFTIRYSRKRSPKPEDIEGNAWLEITWTVVPLVLFLAMFYFGWTNFAYTRNPPPDAMVVNVVGRQWSWGFEYPNGKKAGHLYLALDRPVRIDVTSTDVIHGFYIADFRIKIDAVPKKMNTTWFIPTQLGAYDIQCTVICGPDHSAMLAKAVVVSEAEFKEWYFGGPDAAPPGAAIAAGVSAAPDPPGLALLKAKGCVLCHSIDGRVTVGPTFKGAFGSKEVVLEDGKEREVTVDEAFIRAKIADPLSHRLKGYPPAMPVIPMTDAEIDRVIEYVKTLK